MSIFKTKTVLFLGLSCIGLAFANPQLVFNSVSPEELRAKIASLKSLRQSETLSEAERERLDNLWEQASAIQQMNDHCGNISLTEELDENCERFYKYELPKFETEFFNITGEIRLSPARLSNTIEQRRNAIRQCYEALPVEAFHPSRYLSLEGNYSAEPLSQGVEISYNFELENNQEALYQLENRMEQWNSVCGTIVLHSDNSGNFAPIFLDLVRKSEEQADGVNGSLYFKIGANRYRNPYLAVISKNGIQGNYYINGKKLFNHSIEPGETIFQINIEKNRNIIDFRQGNQWRDKIILKDEDVEKGIVGRFRWQNNGGNSRNSRVKPSSTSYAPDNVSGNDFSYSEDYSNDYSENPQEVENRPARFAFQVTAGINLSTGEATHDAKEKFHFSSGENDTLELWSPMIGGLFSVDFPNDISLGFGGGIVWHFLDENECNSYGECDDNYIFKHAADPMVQAELAYGFDLVGGIRGTYVFDKDAPTFYLGGFAELANLFGIEIGWVHAENIWNNLYVGMYFKFLPKRFSERVVKLRK